MRFLVGGSRFLVFWGRFRRLEFRGPNKSQGLFFSSLRLGFVRAACEVLGRAEASEGLGFRVFSPSQTVRVVWAAAALQAPNPKVFELARTRILVMLNPKI